MEAEFHESLECAARRAPAVGLQSFQGPGASQRSVADGGLGRTVRWEAGTPISLGSGALLDEVVFGQQTKAQRQTIEQRRRRREAACRSKKGRS